MSKKKDSGVKWCAYCGTQAPSGSLYCPHCGEPIDPSYLYDEGISSEGTLSEEAEETGQRYKFAFNPFVPGMSTIEVPQVLYEGMIRGSVTGETTLRLSPQGMSGSLRDVYFVMKLEEKIGTERIPDEILVYTWGFGYFGVGDKVILQGKIIKTVLREWERPMYTILARDFYNESLQIGDERLMEGRRVLYKGMIRGSVMGESKTRIKENARFDGTCFAMRLEGNIGIEGIPDKFLVRTKRVGYFRKGDKVVFQGRLIRANLRYLERPMYLIIADHYYNESLQIGDEGLSGREQVVYEGIIRGSITRGPLMSYFETFFAMKLEENIGIEEVPDEILVRYNKKGHFTKGDEVILQGILIKKDLKQWGRPTYIIYAEDLPNE